MGDSSRKPNPKRRRKRKGRLAAAALLNTPNNPAPRRSTRRNPLPSPSPPRASDEDEQEESDPGRRREKKLKLVLKMQNSAAEASGSDGEGEGSTKKRPINAVGVGGGSSSAKGGVKNSPWKGTPSKSEAGLNSGPTTPLPDKKLLIFILERIQKKDTYGVFSEPVDPEELPDYFDLIEHPMDFGTVRSNLSSGAYANLEQFEKDVFLICSNAMRYNAPDTIYYRQARSMQEVARKNFENMRQGGDGNEPEVKVVRRGRPPGKASLKKQLGRVSVERVVSEATLASAPDSKINAINDSFRKASDKSGIHDFSSRNRNFEAVPYAADYRTDEFSGFGVKGTSRFFKKPTVLDENRRDTYNQSLQSLWDREPSVTTTFQHERKQLIPVGMYGEHSYARSLARFAANLGPVAWRVASKKIERSLPPGTKFGPGWVGESECSQASQPPLFANKSYQSLQPPEQSQQLCPTRSSNCSSAPVLPAPKTDKLVPQQGASSSADIADVSILHHQNPSSSRQGMHSVAMAGPESSTRIREADSNACSSSNAILTRCNSQQQSLPNHSPINGYYGFFPNSSLQSGKLSNSGDPPPRGSSNAEVGLDSRNVDVANCTTNSFRQEDGNHTPTSSKRPTLDPKHVGQVSASQSLQMQPSYPGMLVQSDSDTAPPDLNVQFQSPNSPSSGGMMVDQKQPGLALQL